MSTGEVDFLEISTYDALQKYEADDTVTVIKYPEGRVNNMAINAFSPKFEDRRLVEAVFLPWTRRLSLRAHMEKGRRAGHSPLSNVNLFYNAGNPYYEQDVEKAKEIVKELQAEGTTLTLVTNTNEGLKNMALVIQQQLKEVGLNMEITPLESSGYMEKIFSDDTDFDMYMMGYAAAGIRTMWWQACLTAPGPRTCTAAREQPSYGKTGAAHPIWKKERRSIKSCRSRFTKTGPSIRWHSPTTCLQYAAT